MSERKTPRVSFSILLLAIIAAMAIFFLTSGISGQSGEAVEGNSMTFMILGVLGIIFVMLMVSRFMGKMPLPTPRVTLTMLQCTKCAFKSIRDFRPGDHIPKPIGACPSCGAPFIVEQIYREEPPQRKRREESI